MHHHDYPWSPHSTHVCLHCILVLDWINLLWNDDESRETYIYTLHSPLPSTTASKHRSSHVMITSYTSCASCHRCGASLTLRFRSSIDNRPFCVYLLDGSLLVLPVCSHIQKLTIVDHAAWVLDIHDRRVCRKDIYWACQWRGLVTVPYCLCHTMTHWSHVY